MARNIGADATEMWRAALIFKEPETGELVYQYNGLYSKRSTAVQLISSFRNSHPDFYDGWPEKATLTWHKEKD